MIVIGHSGHGYMALAYAKKYPQNISRVVLIGLSPDSSAESFAAADRYLEESVCPERKALLAESMQHLVPRTLSPILTAASPTTRCGPAHASGTTRHSTRGISGTA